MRAHVRYEAPVGAGASTNPAPTKRTTAKSAAALAVAAVAALAGCASGTNPSNNAEVAAPAQPAGQVVTQCKAADLSIAAGRPGVAMGHAGLALEFTNTGSASCYVQGYPSVAAVLPHGQLKAAQKPNGYIGGELPGNQPPRVTIKPGAKAVAVLEWVDFVEDGKSVASPSTCPGYGATALLVTTPGDASLSNAKRLPNVGTSACADFEVHPAIAAANSPVNLNR